MFKTDKYLSAIDRCSTLTFTGRVTEIVGLLIRATMHRGAVGEICRIVSPLTGKTLMAEIVGFRGSEAILMPLGDVSEIQMNAGVSPTGKPLRVGVGDSLLGRIVDGLGNPIDSYGDLTKTTPRSVYARPPEALSRRRIEGVMPTGIRAVDGLLTIGEGQRTGIFAAAGVGKSTILGMLARNTSADVNVICLIGERGREVRDFLENDLGEEGLNRSAVVVATSNEPSLVRMKAALTATAIAEHFRDQGKSVLLLMDSVTRYARALREIGLAVGEPPARSGFPPSVFSELPKLLERTGNGKIGSITAFYTVLVEGDDMNEPVADEVRSILDGHIVLSRDLAAASHYPAIDIGNSVSRVMPAIVSRQHLEAAARFRQLLAKYDDVKDLIQIGAYRSGNDPETDLAVSMIAALNAFLTQSANVATSLDETVFRLSELCHPEKSE
jgi:type III secretion system H+-transporting two-sector ATPase